MKWNIIAIICTFCFLGILAAAGKDFSRSKQCKSAAVRITTPNNASAGDIIGFRLILK
jgi:hypothetical protein